jgi:hypothetical protein
MRVPSKLLLANVLAAAATTAVAQPGKTITYHAIIDTVKYVYGPAEPVARLRPGDMLDTNTLDSALFGRMLKQAGEV